MRASLTHPRRRTRGVVVGLVTTAVLALSVIGSSTALAADSRNFSVTVGTPTQASQGGATKFDVTVNSADNQTIANVKLSIPAAGSAWPTDFVIASIFGPNGGACTFKNTSATCNFGNIEALGSRSITVLVNVPMTATVGSSVTFSASAETNNENGSNRQVVSGTSTPVSVVAFNANSLVTANQSGSVATSALGAVGAGNLQTTLNLLGTNGGHGNVIAISEGTNTTQPSACVALKLTCQPDFVDLTVNSGTAVQPYLETILKAKVPSSYNLNKAFVIHVLADGTIDSGFPLFNSTATSCAAHPSLVPCADFSLSKQNVLTITVHTATNGKYNF